MRTVWAGVITFLSCAATCLAQGYICAEGGGTGSGPWAAEMFGWMAEKGKNGPAVLLGAVELDAADRPDAREAALVKAGARSAKSLIITEKNADSQEVYDAITAASIVFIRGGSQSRYVEMWKGTKTEAAIRAVFEKGGVIGGTSAGCAILGELSYDARNGSLKPEEIVKDARHPDLTLTRGFLGFVPGVLFDTHFGERARLPRLITMLGHCQDDLKLHPVGIGLDPRTALCVSPDGSAQVRGEGYATFLELTRSTMLTLVKDQPPTATNVRITIVPAGAKYNLRTRQFQSALSPRPPTIDHWSMDLKVVSVPARTESTEPRPKAKWTAITTTAGGPAVWCVADPYAEPRAVMDRAHAAAGEPALIVLAPPGAEAAFAADQVVIGQVAGAPASSAVVLDATRHQQCFSHAELKKPSLFQGVVHLLPPGWALNTRDGKPFQPAKEPAQSP